MSKDKQSAYQTLYYVLVCTTKLFAPVAPIISEKMYQILTGEFSVHLSVWPEIAQKFANEKLIDDVAFVQEVISLARSIRSKNRVKNRQPLRSLKVALSDCEKNDVIEAFGDVIADELNVKQIEILEDAKRIADVKYDPNFQVIRSKYPDRIAEIIKAVKSGNFRMAQDRVMLQTGNREEQFDADIILVTYRAKDGQPVACGGDIIVSLDLTITEELRAEGLARDLVRNIQDARKQIGCEITDTVLLAFEGDVPKQWLDYICKETLGRIGTVLTPESVVALENENGKQVKVFVSSVLE